MSHREQPVTVVFIDVGDSTAMYARRGDRDVFEVISALLGMLADAVARGGGTALKRLGDVFLRRLQASGADPLRGDRGSLTQSPVTEDL
jgi:class 3 adenylate cyclase